MIKRKRTLAPAGKRRRQMSDDEHRAAIETQHPRPEWFDKDVYNSKISELIANMALGRHWRAMMLKAERNHRRA